MTETYYLNTFTNGRATFCVNDPVLETLDEAIDDIIQMERQGFELKHTIKYAKGGVVLLPMLAMVQEQMADNEAEAIHARGDLPAYRQAAR